MEILEEIKYHCDNKKYAEITRKVSEDKTKISTGYIFAYSDDFILLNEFSDFLDMGYHILPIEQLIRIRFNRVDKYFDKMIKMENLKLGAKFDDSINLNSWQSILKTLKERDQNIIVECEATDIDAFTIGPIIKIGTKYVYIKYFDAEGFFDEEPISLDYASITRVQFDTPYIDVFSKYTRHKRSAK